MSNLKLTVHPPHEQLKNYVRRVLITLGDEETDEVLPIGPTGFSYLTYSRYPITLHYKHRILESDEQLYISGQIEKEQPYFAVKGNFFHVGLELIPSLPYYIFGIPGEKLTDNGMLVRQLNPEFAEKFISEVRSEKEPLMVASLLQKYLINYVSRIEPESTIDDSLQIIYKRNGNIEISELEKATGFSARHLRRQFRRIVGIPPKKYCKIIQFNAVFEAIQTGNEKALYDLSLENGYYDHAHFINDFKTHLGKSPREFLRSEHGFLKSYLGTFRD